LHAAEHHLCSEYKKQAKMKEASKKISSKLSIYPAAYQIKVPGILDPHGSEWDERLTITAESEDGSFPVTVLEGTLDQAALQGLLRRLYALGLPLISVTWMG
jgi:hypothetical protein